MKLLFFCLMFLAPAFCFAQVIVNGDLEGPTNAIGSTLAQGWQAVPVGDPNSIASNPGIGDTPDLTSTSGPLQGNGIFGNPYSGNTFMSGFISSDGFGNRHHEGIMQTITGLMPDSTYEIGFMQAVVKQNNCLDEAGSWAFYLDNTLVGISVITSANNPFNNLNLNWHLQTFLFTPTATTHTLKFMPTDDDNVLELGANIFGALRMGIDSIHFRHVPCNLVVDLGPDTTVCAGQGVLLTAANPNATYTWSTGSVSPSVVASQTGTYWVKVTNGTCSTTDTVTITSLPLPQVSLANDTALCLGDQLVIEAVATPGSSLLWHTGDTTSVITATFTANYQVWATVQGCTATDDMMVQFHPYPNISLGADTAFCLGAPLLLSAAQENGTYSWSTGVTTPTLEVSQAGQYAVTVTQNGCTSSDTVVVTMLPLPGVSLGNDTAFCEGQNVLLTAATAAPDIVWYNGTTGQTTRVSQTGTYWVTAYSNGCQNSDTISVVVKPLPVVHLGNHASYCLGDVVQLNAETPGAVYLWQDGASGSSYMATQPGSYWVDISLDGCTARSNVVELSFTDCTTKLVMPNVFSPNNDGVNDLFEPEASNALISLQTTVFNRWGKVVFESDRMDTFWDGTSGGEPLPEGTYFYQITYDGQRDGAGAIKGWVSIVR